MLLGMYATPAAGCLIINRKGVPVTGIMVRRFWYAIWRSEKRRDKKWLQQEVVKMMLQGSYPEWLSREAFELSMGDDFNGDNVTALELLDYGVKKIHYDKLLYQLKWGPLNEAEKQMLCQLQT